MKISQLVQNIIKNAFNEAKKQQHEFVTPEHLLKVFLDNKQILEFLDWCGADLPYLTRSVDEYLKTRVPVAENKGQADPVQTIGFSSIIDRTLLHCASAEKKSIEYTDVLVSLYDEKNNHCSYFLKNSGISRLNLLENITYLDMLENSDSNVHSNLTDIEKDTDSALIADLEKLDELSKQNKKQKAKQNEKVKKTFLERFTTNLNEEAREGKLDTLIGRDEEIERTIQILCRRTKNNPVHVGDAGTGKTAITEGLAQRIVSGEVPDFLKDFKILSLDMTALIAGTKFRGDFEDRIKKLGEELLKEQSTILFIDEVHGIFGAGSSASSGLDASNLLKPLLAKNTFRCIGSTTHEEYAKTFEKDRALARRFQKIDIIEPTEAETIEILKGLQERYETHHQVQYTDEALEAAVVLSKLYITERRLPDKAIDLIDEAGAYLRLHPTKDQKVTKQLIEKTLSKITRIPEKTVSSDEKTSLKSLDSDLKKEIFGQNEAIEAITKSVKRSRAGFRAPEKPIANFLFAGPTGVGKTELAKKLAELLNISFLRFDMSEYQEKHTVSRLIGSPPGYVGSEDGGLLSDAVRKNPHALILFDEIEKAHPDIYNLLLQIMDYASLTDNHGKKADFRSSIIIMTSNAGARDINKPMIGFGDQKVSSAAIKEAVEKIFTPEFRNRLDAIIPFNSLDEKTIRYITKNEIKKLNERLFEKNVEIRLSDDCIHYLAKEGYSAEFGARNISRTIDEKISEPLVEEVLFGKLEKGGIAHCSIKDGKIEIEYEAKAKKRK